MTLKMLLHVLGFIVSIPARIKGMKFARGAFIGPGYDWLFVQLTNISLGENVLIGRRAWICTLGDGAILIGKGTSIGRDATIAASKRISIGNNVLVSYGVSFLDHDHEFRSLDAPPIMQGITPGEEISVGDNCFIGARSFVLKGVSLGRHCVVGANSVVTSTFPEGSLIAGNPARLIRRLGC